MSKKIVAVSLALVLIVTCFVACGKKYETTKINGEEVILVTDENGDPVINDENQVIALVTDEAGKVIKYSSGEDQTRYIDIFDALEVKGVAYGEKYKMNILDGWEVGNGSRIYKKGTDNKSYIQFTPIKQTSKDYTLETYLEKIDNQNAQIFDANQQQEYKLTVDKSIGEISGGIVCNIYVYKIADANGNVVHYAENYYFTAGTMIYSVSYACEEGKGYDESFDFGSYLRTNFTFVD